jgi:riboflavin kinase/FMN adenylyltransferase
MEIYNHIAQAKQSAKDGVVILGNFDGLHFGHQAVIGLGVEIAKSLGKQVSVVTFEPHPKIKLAKVDKHFMIASKEHKIELMEKYGVDHLFLLDFSEDFSKLTPDEFADLCIVQGLNARHVVVGDNFLFGYMASGNIQTLQNIGEQKGFAVDVVQNVKNISSTRIRKAISQGDMTEVHNLTGRFWRIEGVVEKGFERGRTLGFPTANISIDKYIHPQKGVYAVKVGIERLEKIVWHNAIANFGIRPTFNLQKHLVEINIFDFKEDIYNKKIYVNFVDFIRAEKKFSSAEMLVKQIDMDVKKAKQLFEKEE